MVKILHLQPDTKRTFPRGQIRAVESNAAENEAKAEQWHIHNTKIVDRACREFLKSRGLPISENKWTPANVRMFAKKKVAKSE